MPTVSRSTSHRAKHVRPADWIRDRRFARFARLFNRREFFRAHEVLEELWLEVEGPDRPFLQGLIQLAVALEHDARGNPSGARKVLRSAGSRLAAFGERYAGVAHGDLQQAVAAWLDRRTDAPPRMPEARKGTLMGKPHGASVRGKSKSAALRSGAAKIGSVGARSKPAAVRRDAAKVASLGGKSKSAALRSGAAKIASVRGKSAIPGGKWAPVKKRSAAPTRPAGAGRGAARSEAAQMPTPLEPIDARRARALAIADGLTKLYPDAKCEMQHASVLELLVATILSAQCTDARVNMTTPALFAKYRDAADYARADFDELCTIIKSTGFFNNKARSIIALGKALEERHGGRVPETMEELVALPGVGRKTANVLLSEWFGEPGIAVDTHVIRLTGPIWRLTDETDPVKIEFALYDLLPEDRRSFFGIATIFHGRRTCIARRPNCSACALVPLCPSARVE